MSNSRYYKQVALLLSVIGKSTVFVPHIPLILNPHLKNYTLGFTRFT
jgi:hypothetical protein